MSGNVYNYDIVQLMHHFCLTDNSVWLSLASQKCVLSTLTYQAIANSYEGKFSNEAKAMRRFTSTAKLPLNNLLEEDMLIFPCKY